MRKDLFLAGALLLASACASPKYTYYFDHYDYNSGKKNEPVVAHNDIRPSETTPLAVDENALTASAAPVEVVPTTPVTESAPTAASPEEARSILAKKYNSLSKSEKKEFRQTAKKQLKAYVKATRNGDRAAAEDAVKAMDYDLKMAIIFGAVGLTLSLFGGVSEAFWILGVIAIVIGVVFLVKWLVRQ